MSETAVKVVIDGAILPIDKPYTYQVPENLTEKAKLGVRVTVPFGKGNIKKQGLIIGLCDTPPDSKLKSIQNVIDDEPLLDESLLGIVSFLKETTFCTWFDAVKCVLPYGVCCKIVETYVLCDDAKLDLLQGDEYSVASIVKLSPTGISKKKLLEKSGLDSDNPIIPALIKKGIITRSDLTVRNTGDATQKMIRLTDLSENTAELKLTPKQKSALAVLNDAGCCSVKELCYFSGVSSVVINGLAKKGVAEIFEQTYYRTPASGGVQKQESPTLVGDQVSAYNTLLKLLDKNESAAALLYGVTGSGKTQVFLKLCEKAISENKGVIIMVPEIALTPQTVNKFKALFSNNVAVFHSAMSQGQRMDEWKRVKDGQATIAVGTRSAIFAPVKNLGLIVMDEEQEHTYKSEMSPRFHARDVAKFRAAKENALFLMASATPSVETYYAAKEGRYTLCELGERYGTAKLPTVQTVDMRTASVSGNKALSPELVSTISDTLDAGHQVILLLNRRGRNTYVSCAKCGHVIKCDNCSLAMTYHSANNRVMCHYCGKSEPYVSKCPECGSEHVRYSGWGTQKVEEDLQECFPDAKILRMDSDSTGSRDSYEKNLTAFANGDYDIMLGTQMVAKGLDFPNVTLVGVISADQSMYSTDYRAIERTFSLLTQVIGRSGRGDSEGMAMVQTAFPDNDVISLATEQNYKKFFEEEILTRKLMIYPPFCDIAQVVIQGVDKEKTESCAFSALKKIEELCGGEYSDVKVIVLGPTAASVPRVNGKWRWRMMIKCHNGKRVRALLNEVIGTVGNDSKGLVTLSVDMNPETLL